MIKDDYTPERGMTGGIWIILVIWALAVSMWAFPLAKELYIIGEIFAALFIICLIRSACAHWCIRSEQAETQRMIDRAHG